MHRHLMINSKGSILFIFVGIVCLLQACSDDFAFESGKDVPRPKATNIEEVIIQPHPVPINSSFKIECIIKDSSNKNFEFSWIINRYDSKGTDSNSVKFQSPDTAGIYDAGVTIYDNVNRTRPASESFEIKVIDTTTN
jgi:hypothetical protein